MCCNKKTNEKKNKNLATKQVLESVDDADTLI